MKQIIAILIVVMLSITIIPANALVYNFLFKFGYQEDTFGTGIATDSNDRIIVAVSNSIQIFDSNGNFIKSFGSGGNGITTDSKDRIIVIHIFTVQVFDKDGNLITSFGHIGSGDGEFGESFFTDSGPEGITTDSMDRIIVADTGNSRIQVFEPSPSYDLILFEGSNKSDKVIKIGENITAKAITDDDTINNVTIQWVDPDNNIR